MFSEQTFATFPKSKQFPQNKNQKKKTYYELGGSTPYIFFTCYFFERENVGI
jgi:hypothetical protein